MYPPAPTRIPIARNVIPHYRGLDFRTNYSLSSNNNTSKSFIEIFFAIITPFESKM